MVFPATSVFIGVHPWFPFLPAQPESRAGVVVSPADPGGGTRALYGSQDGRRYFAPLCEPHPLTRSRDCGTTLSPIGREGRGEGAVGFGEHIFSPNRETREIRRSRNLGEQDESARNRGHAKVSNTEKVKRSFPIRFRVVRVFRGSLNFIVPAMP